MEPNARAGKVGFVGSEFPRQMAVMTFLVALGGCSRPTTTQDGAPAEGESADANGAVDTGGGAGMTGPVAGSGGHNHTGTTDGAPGAADTTTGGEDVPDGDTTVSHDDTIDDTTSGDSCDTWCDGYPTNEGCDEEDDGVVAEEGGSSGGTGGAEDTGIGKGDDFPLATSVYELQLGDVAIGEYVQLDDVVVTSPPAPRPDGPGLVFTVEEPGGGPYSGITVRATSTPSVDALEPGDVVTLVGDHQLRYVFSILALSYDGATVTDVAPMPDPVVIPAEEIETVSAGGMDAKPLESVLIRVLQPEIVDPRPCGGEIEIQAGLRIDDRFLDVAGEWLPSPPRGGFSAVVGPLLYTYNGFEVAPRSLDDFED